MPTYLPVTYDSNGIFKLTSPQSDYWGYKPDTYSDSKPIALFIWMHGCGGNAAGDVWNICPPATRQTQSYIGISLGGRDGACWQTGVDGPKVLAAIEHIKKYFNIDANRIFLGGYSSGGDMTYRIGMTNAKLFAGLLIHNSDSFGSGASLSSLMQAASWKINIAQLNHLSDTTYPIDKCRANLATLKANGFPVVAMELPGSHYDQSTASSGTNYDQIHTLLPMLDKGWTLPGTVTPPPVVPPVIPIIDLTKMRVVARATSTWEQGCCTEFDIMNFSKVSSASWTEAKINLGTNIIRTKPDGTPDVWGCTVSAQSGSVTVKPVAYSKNIMTGSKATIGMATDFGNGLTSPTYVSGSLK